MELTRKEQEDLLEIARSSIVAALKGEVLPPARTNSPSLLQKRGVFVSLKKQGELRGCIGFIESDQSLVETTQEAALKAAFEDPRFDPLQEEEMDDIDIEISVLSPIKQIKDIKEIQIGRDGLIIERGGARGLLLPQVATEYGWKCEEFLENTCRKAGLPPNAWMLPQSKLYIFTVQNFSEKDLK